MGRPLENWDGFERVKVGDKIQALCLQCKRTLANTSFSRRKDHR